MSDIHPLRVLLKAVVIFVMLNLIYAAIDPPVGRLSIYNWLVKGRERLPYGGPPGSYNVSIDDLSADFAVHVISGQEKSNQEYRVLLLGDSQTWGWLRKPSETLTARLNDAHLSACGKRLRFYNLAYPVPSVIRDFLILREALRYKPDAVIWLLTLNSLTSGSRSLSQFSDGGRSSQVLEAYGLKRYAPLFEAPPTFIGRTLVGQRTRLAKLTVLEIDGLLWEATGVDAYFRPFTPLPVDVAANDKYRNMSPPVLPSSSMAFGVLAAAHRLIGDVPILIVNEPIYVAPGRNSSIRYNNHYPRWAYDQYRELLAAKVARQHWHYVDLHDAIPYSEFTNNVAHLTIDGENTLARSVAPEILKLACP